MPLSVNKLGLSKDDYKASKSTLCTGCGHDSITNHLISALYQSHVNPYFVAKLSGIGCSSKTPAYFLSRSHGFNTIHGRMAPVATGVKIANRKLRALGVSGDGDTGSIGLSGFIHMIRRGLPITYIIENNGVYGLTKGQFSATADKGSLAKSNFANPYQGLDLCALAIEAGAGFVARSFSGDGKQLTALLTAALQFEGSAIIDVLSPCVTFANNDGSSKSFHAIKEHNVPLHELGVIEPQAEITVDYEQGESRDIPLPGGWRLKLRKLADKDHDVHDPLSALKCLESAKANGEFLTGLIYFDDKKANLISTLGLTEKPLALLNETETRPSVSEFEKILDRYR